MPKVKLPTEEEEHIKLAEYLENRFGYHGWIHPPMQRWAKVQYKSKLKKMGAKKGFPDILIFDPVVVTITITPVVYCGVALELKRQKGGTIEPEQSLWLDELGLRNWYPIVARGAKDAITQLDEVYGPWMK